MMSVGYRKWLREKYRCPGFVEVEAGDCVVDCGGFVGGFATSIADIAGVVHVVEPSPQNFGALLRNIADLPNVHAHNIGLFDRDSTLTLNLSTTFVDDSFLAPDAGASGQTVQVRVRRVDEWARELGLERIDFMKVEAEGVETEIVKSIGNLPVGKIAVDCSPERDGVSNLDEIAAHLEAEGFAVTARGWMLFARPKKEQPGRATPEPVASVTHTCSTSGVAVPRRVTTHSSTGIARLLQVKVELTPKFQTAPIIAPMRPASAQGASNW